MNVKELVKYFPSVIVIMIIAISSGCKPEVYNYDRSKELNDTIFTKGNVITNSNFSGTAYLGWLVQNDSIFNCPIGNVTFEPGARTNWHKHPGGQILLVTEGVGYYQQRGKQARVIRKGDVVTIGPDVEHWHGATADSGLVHVAINTNIQAGSVVWLQPVTDEEYNNLK